MMSIRSSILFRVLVRNSIPSPRIFCTFVPKKLRKMGLLPEKSLASHENQYFRWQVEATEAPVLQLTRPAPASVSELETLWKKGETLESANHADLVKTLVEELPKMERESVIHVLYVLANMRKSHHEFDNQNALWYAIDSVLIRDHKKAERTENQLLETLDHSVLLSSANPGRIPRLVCNLNGSLLKRLSDLQMDKERLLKFMFNLNLARDPLPASCARILENEVMKYMDDMTIDEVGLVAAAFFKTQTKIHNPVLVIKLAHKAMDKQNRTPDKIIALTSIFKSLRYQILGPAVNHVRDLIDSFSQDELRQLSPTTLNHLCRLATSYQKHSPDLIRSAIESLSASVRSSGERTRFKDVVEILRSCDDFCYTPDPGLMNQIISCWPSDEEVTSYPKYFISYLSLLASLDHYPKHLIEKCFSRHYLRQAKEICTPFPHIALLSLHTILSINCHPLFDGRLLRPEEVEESVRGVKRVDMSILLENDSRANTFTMKSLKRLFRRCKIRFGQQAVLMFTLPYLIHPDIVLIPDGRDVQWLKTRKLVPGSFTGCSIVLLESRQYFADYGTTVPRNFFARKKQLLQKLGFRIYPIHFAEIGTSSDTVLGLYLSKVDV